MEDIYNKYDRIIQATLLNISASSKHSNSIVLKDFDYNDPNHLYFFEVVKMANTFWSTKIILDMPFFKYLLFKRKHKNLDIKKATKKELSGSNSIDIYKILSFIQKAFEENNRIFMDIFEAYYKKENK